MTSAGIDVQTFLKDRITKVLEENAVIADSGIVLGLSGDGQVGEYDGHEILHEGSANAARGIGRSPRLHSDKPEPRADPSKNSQNRETTSDARFRNGWSTTVTLRFVFGKQGLGGTTSSFGNGFCLNIDAYFSLRRFMCAGPRL